MITDKQIVVDGQFVSQRISQVIEAIHERYPDVEVQWIPPGARSEGEAAFRLIHRPEGGEPYIIRHVKTEEEFTTAVLMDLIAGDQQYNKVTISMVEAAEEAARLVAEKRWQDEMEETMEIMHTVFNSPLNTYRLNKDVVIKEGIPFNAKGY
jgi:hypothetical protein